MPVPLSNSNGSAKPKIPLVDLKAQYASLRPEMDAAIQKVLDSTQYLGGEAVEALERDFAAYCETPHAIAVDSGSVALELGLKALQFQPGDEVIVPAHTFIATANAIELLGLCSVIVDVDPETWQMEPERVLRAMTPRTRAVMSVHLYGQPVPVDPLRELCEGHNVLFL